MKNLINKILKPFNAEIHGKGYLKALSAGDFNKDEYAFQKEFLNNLQVKVIFDVGSNRGDTVKKYLEMFPNAIIHAFEPFPASFNTLNSLYNNNPRVQLNELGISDKIEKAKMFVNNNVDTNSLYESRKLGLSSDKSVKNISKIEIKTTSIEDYCLIKGIGEIDILKLDIQGGELNALIGSSNLLNSKKIKLIYTETYFIKQYDKQPLFFEIGDYLQKHDYYLQDMYSKIYGNGSLAWCDSIFLPK